MPDLYGRTAVVTGAGSGLGLIATRRLAERGATVVMAVRDRAKGERMRADLLRALPSADLRIRPVDLSDLDSVRAFATAVTAEAPRIDLLLNNAGIATQPFRLSAQGYESQFATNHLGHFALTLLLLDSLGGGTDPRVVTVSSGLYPRGTLNLDDVTSGRGYSPGRAYVRSKLANALFAVELDRRLRSAGSPVRSLLTHPGMARTPMHDSAGTVVAKLFVTVVGALLGRDAEAGAEPLLHAATAPGLPGGTFVGPQKLLGAMRPGPVPLLPPAGDPDLAARLWRFSEQATGLTWAAAARPAAGGQPVPGTDHG